jgi:hypothetical protein
MEKSHKGGQCTAGPADILKFFHPHLTQKREEEDDDDDDDDDDDEVLRHEGVWGSGCIQPRFLHLSTSWR